MSKIGSLCAVAGSCFIQLIFAGFLCPFTGPSMGDVLLGVFSLVILFHAVAAAAILILPRLEVKWNLALLAIASMPVAVMVGVGFAESRRDPLSERFAASLGYPVPQSVANLQWVRNDEAKSVCNRCIIFQFDIAPNDLDLIIQRNSFVLLEDSASPGIEYWKHLGSKLPGQEGGLLYYGKGEHEAPVILKVSADKKRVVFVKDWSGNHMVFVP